MTKTFMARSTWDTDPIETSQNRAERKRLALQRIFACMPAQIDAIKEQRVCAAIELRSFMMASEAYEVTGKRNAARRKNPAISVSASP
jgi:hypothetical protein